jgi:hypothetical protein
VPADFQPSKAGRGQYCSAPQLPTDIPDEWHEVCAMVETEL